MLEAAQPDRLDRSPLRVEFVGDLKALAPRVVDLSNQTWSKREATELARTGQRVMAARWRVGAGEVIAAAFSTTPAEARAMADLIARQPRDPRFTVSVRVEEDARIRIDAIDAGRYLNHLVLRAQLGPDAPQQIPQTAPGRYELGLPAPHEPTFVTVTDEAGHVLDRVAIAGRYTPEFDAIGNSHEKMQRLAEQTGGAVVEPSQRSPIPFALPRRATLLASELAIAGAASIALALVFWKRGGAMS